LKTEPKYYAETSGTNSNYSLRNSPETSGSHTLRGGSLTSHISRFRL